MGTFKKLAGVGTEGRTAAGAVRRGRWLVAGLLLLVGLLSLGQEGRYDGEYSGKLIVLPCDGNLWGGVGTIRFTVSGRSIQGTATGNFSSTYNDNTRDSTGPESFSVSFQGTTTPKDATTDSFDVPASGTSGGRPVRWRILGSVGRNGKGGLGGGGGWNGSSGCPVGIFAATGSGTHVPTGTTGTDTHSQTGSTGDSKGSSGPVTGLGSVGNLPGPDTVLQGVTGVVVPGLLITLIGLVGTGLLGSTPQPTPVGPGPSPGPSPDGGTEKPTGYLPTGDQAPEDHEAKSNKDEWIRQRQDDLRAISEEKAHLQAVIDGVQPKGFDVSEHLRRMDQLNQRIGDLHDQLGKEGADIDYVAQDRGVISPGQDFVVAVQQNKDLKQQTVGIDYLDKLQQEAVKQGLWNIGGPGDMVGKLQDMKDALRDGKAIDSDKLRQIQGILGDHVTGAALTPDKVPEKEHLGGWLDRGLLWDAGWETAKNFGQLKTGDGKMAWGALGGRIVIDALTDGAAEPVFVAASGITAVKDNIDKGGDDAGWAFWDGVKEAGSQYLVGKLAEGGAKLVVGGVKGGIVGGVDGALSGVKKSGQEFAKELVKEGKALADGVKGGADKLKGLWPSSGEGIPTGDVPTGSTVTTPLSADQEETLKALRDAVKSGDGKTVCDLYKDGGLKKLVDLQGTGNVDEGLAKECNRLLKGEVNECVKDATKNSVATFKQKTGVDIEEILVGDSGSGAKTDIARLKTDADRTLLPRFKDESLDAYVDAAKADGREITRAQAADELSKKFKDIHDIEMDKSLASRGLGKNDIRYSSYDRIGAKSGQADAYGERTTNCKQAADGVTDVYKVNPDGSVRNPYRTSGETLVDQNNLDKAKLDPSKGLTEDPTKIRPRDVPDYVKEQQAALVGKDDPVQAAKSISRADKGASILGDSLGDSDLTNASQEIYEHPEQVNAILTKYKFTDLKGNPDPDKFVTYSKFKLNNYVNSLPTPPKA